MYKEIVLKNKDQLQEYVGVTTERLPFKYKKDIDLLGLSPSNLVDNNFNWSLIKGIKKSIVTPRLKFFFVLGSSYGELIQNNYWKFHMNRKQTPYKYGEVKTERVVQTVFKTPNEHKYIGLDGRIDILDNRKQKLIEIKSSSQNIREAKLTKAFLQNYIYWIGLNQSMRNPSYYENGFDFSKYTLEVFTFRYESKDDFENYKFRRWLLCEEGFKTIKEKLADSLYNVGKKFNQWKLIRDKEEPTGWKWEEDKRYIDVKPETKNAWLKRDCNKWYRQKIIIDEVD
jgi:hypothetical protein